MLKLFEELEHFIPTEDNKTPREILKKIYNLWVITYRGHDKARETKLDALENWERYHEDKVNKIMEEHYNSLLFKQIEQPTIERGRLLE